MKFDLSPAEMNIYPVIRAQIHLVEEGTTEEKPYDRKEEEEEVVVEECSKTKSKKNPNFEKESIRKFLQLSQTNSL